MFEIIDLTKLLDKDLSIYTDNTYSDPPLQVETWCTIQEQGFKVSRLSMGTQTGTHIDAPAHFVADGATLETLPIQALIGQYLWLDLDRVTEAELRELPSRCNGMSILFLTSSRQTKGEISEEVFRALLKLPCLVWVIVYGVQVMGCEPLYFHQVLAEAGKYLIEDIDESMAVRVRADGEMIALPLRLSGSSGSPCRVIVRQSVR
jgi:kynurenine formamidase